MMFFYTRKTSDKLIGDLYVKQDNQAYWIGCTICPNYARQEYSQEITLGLL
ncbi:MULTISPECIES: hypothetical protein [unclassified Clostridioides]|uniref:hypothetical protein n=1 Tax=unclassified Clostridioides TaxID=2635829 RepID=UPI001D1288BE|nr:hypothetical protein [Clostridioides sp. ES-S-0171-01]MCC0687999.1 hypothetical protein [Clostridioides sp. ES-S-0056-01]UDN54914.1 hypothetical protein JJC02_01575 [Clostridioides sp. ES-S-0054-01]